MQDDTRFWDKVARKYAAAPMKDVTSYEQTMARIEAHLRPEFSVLELGAGSGATALRIAPQVRSMLATDVSGEMVAIGREKAEHAYANNIIFRRSGVAQARFPEAPFDAVLALNLLHLLPDMRNALREIHGLLPPGGLFMSKTTCLKGGVIIPLAIKVMQAFGRAPYVGYLSVEELDAAVEEAGFEILETVNAPAKPPARLVVARRL